MSDAAGEIWNGARYRLLEEELNTGEFGKVVCYGLSVVVNDKTVCTCSALSDKRNLVETLITNLNDGMAELCQLYYILDDWFGNL